MLSLHDLVKQKAHAAGYEDGVNFKEMSKEVQAATGMYVSPDELEVFHRYFWKEYRPKARASARRERERETTDLLPLAS